MTRHLDLLASAAKPATARRALPATAVPLLLAITVAAGAGAWLWTRQVGAALDAQLQAARQALRAEAAGSAAPLDATVLAALRHQVEAREAQAAALSGDAQGAGELASAWLDALDAAGAPGLALNQVRIEVGPRLTLAGSAAQASDVHAFLARLQKHPLTGRAAIGQLEVRREAVDAPLAFRLTPPAPAAAAVAKLHNDGQELPR